MNDQPQTQIMNEQTLVYIWSGEHGAYWREGGHGYTTVKEKAGVFTYAYASRFTGRSYADKRIKLEPAQEEYSI